MFSSTPEKKKESILPVLSLAVGTLEQQVREFDYKSLRSVEENQAGTVVLRASDAAIQALFTVFSDTFLQAKDRKIAEFISNPKKWDHSPAEAKEMLRLADSLLFFKKAIAESEYAYFLNKTRNPEKAAMLAKIKSDSCWVQCFHYNVEQYLDKVTVPEAKIRYGKFIHNVKTLGEQAYTWIKQNAPLDAARYAELGSEKAQKLAEKKSTARAEDPTPKAKAAHRKFGMLLQSIDDNAGSDSDNEAFNVSSDGIFRFKM